MKWIKKGLIYTPTWQKEDWRYSSALTPSPFLLNKDIIRVYFGARDIDGISRIGYVDLDSNDPSIIIKTSTKPVLDIGKNGCFDDSGVILGDVIYVNNKIYMYYVGFQKVEKVKFLAFSGLAISTDGGENFQRFSESPILDRSDEGNYIRAIHTIIQENGIWKIWYAAGNKWTYINEIPYPNYHIRYAESKDGISFSKEGEVCIQHVNNEYRIGRPRVYKTDQGYQIFYTKGSTDLSYLPGMAISKDGINWERHDADIGISPSENGWDSETLCYTSLLKSKDKTFMFYNGNNMGKDGFGYAVLDSK
jgi:predicted GH43/DUF377 family glycosyl hydrolase